MIPKRLKIQITDGIDLVVTDESKSVAPFLDNAKKGSSNSRKSSSRKSTSSEQNEKMISQEFSLAKLEKTTFELLRKMQNTYYIIVRTDKADLSVNDNFNAVKIEGFT